jgi:DNA adenine methylase
MKPALKYNGSQFRNSKNILTIVDSIEHDTYIEHCAGGLGVLLNKKPSRYEIVNDIDGNVINFFRVLQERVSFIKLIHKLKNTPYSISEMKIAYKMLSMPEHIRRSDLAWAFFVKCWMTRNFNKTVKKPYWLQVVNNIGGGHEPVGNFRKAVENLYLVRDRILKCSIDNRDIRVTLKYYDKPTTLHYIDLPYLGSTRNNIDYYDYEIKTEKEHEEILDSIVQLKGKWIISSYDNDLYSRKLSNFKKINFKTYSNAKTKRIETIYYKDE